MTRSIFIKQTKKAIFLQDRIQNSLSLVRNAQLWIQSGHKRLPSDASCIQINRVKVVYKKLFEACEISYYE